MKHLLSESASWSTTSEFVTSEGHVSEATGRSAITIQEKEIINTSWVQLGKVKRENNYKIISISDTKYHYESINPELGNQIGVFIADRNILYSKFKIEDSSLNGFEIIRREGDTCFAYGALYDNDNPINTWTAIMVKE